MKLLLGLMLAVQQFLLQQPIQNVLLSRDFSDFDKICASRISVMLEEPFAINGYFPALRFVGEFSEKLKDYDIRRLEWSSNYIEENYAIQSLNLVFSHRRVQREIYYKFVFFMKRDPKWKLYFLKGLKL